MTHPRFGLPPRGRHNDLLALERAKPVISSSIALQVTMMEAYDTTYGLFDDRTGNIPPFASQLVHPGESLNPQTGWQVRMREYRSQRVWELFGVSFIDFMSLPKHMVEWILQECEIANADITNAAGAEQDKVENKIKNEKRKTKK